MRGEDHYADNQWHSVSVNVVVPAGATVGDVRLSTYFGPFGAGEVLIDNVELLAPMQEGDFDGDGDVDDVDLGLWRSSFGVDPGADGDSDGDSDLSDLLGWQRNYQQAAPAAAAVPEPASLAVCLASAALAAGRGRVFG